MRREFVAAIFVLTSACASAGDSSQQSFKQCNPEERLEAIRKFVFLNDEQKLLRRSEFQSSNKLRIGISQNEAFDLAAKSFGPVFHAGIVAGAAHINRERIDERDIELSEFNVALLESSAADPYMLHSARYAELSVTDGCVIYAQEDTWRVVGVLKANSETSVMQEAAQQCFVRSFLTHIGITAAAGRPFFEIARCAGNVCSDAPGLLFAVWFLDRSYARDQVPRNQFEDNVRAEVCTQSWRKSAQQVATAAILISH